MVHLGIIPDGHRRYAKKNNISLLESYEIGYNLLMDIIRKFHFMKSDIHAITIYVVSNDNLNKRSNNEISNICYMIKNFIRFYYENKKEIYDKNIKIQIIGNGQHPAIGEDIYTQLLMIEQETKHFTSHELNLAINYDGKQHIINGLKDPLFFKISSNIDIVIRAGLVTRTSGFFPWHTMYAEWFFLPCTWCEVKIEDIIICLESLKKIERRYGK
jgi:undecaprenyl diphosphate synthase